MVDIDLRLQQFAHRLHVAVVRGRDQRGAAVAVGAFQVGACRQRQAQDLQPALGAGIEEGRVLKVVLGIDVGAALDQQPRRLDPVGMGGSQQRGAAPRIARIHRRAGIEQPAQRGQVAGFGRRHQRRRIGTGQRRPNCGGSSQQQPPSHRGAPASVSASP